MSKSLRSRPASSRLLNLLFFVLGVLGILAALVFYDRVFPLAALDLRLSRKEISARAQEAAKAHGFDVLNYKSTLVFGERSWAAFFLHSTMGTEETNRLLREERLPLWYWNMRWFRPNQQEEFSVDLLPDGTLVWLGHEIEEDEPGAALIQEEARTKAERYLTNERGWDLTAWQEVSAASKERPGGRVDHTFEWKRRDWNLAGSELRLSVTIQGDEIGYYDYWLKVPEDFRRDFSSKQSLANVLNDISFTGMMGLLVGGFAVALVWARGNLPFSWKRALIAAVFVGAVTLLAELNWWPLSDVGYNTVQNYTLFKLGRLGSSLTYVLFQSLFVLFLWIAAHWIGKQVWPLEDRILSRRGDPWTNVARSTGRGLLLAGIDFGYMTLFYFVATQVLGAWVPMGPDYNNIYATPLPFMGAITSGVLAATWEEAAFRLFSISVVLWLTRTFTRLPKGWRVALALLIPGALWGFAHSSYVRDPIYFRGIELTLAALLYGAVFLKTDLLTVIVAHYAYNAVLGAIPLLRSTEPAFVVSGLVVFVTLLLPLLPWAIRALRRRDTERASAPIIRPGRAEDAAALATLAVDEETWCGWLAAEATIVFCLESHDQVIGVAAAEVQGETAQLLVLTVAPAWRRQYWGSELLQRLSDELKAQGAEFLEATTPSGNAACRQFFVSQKWPVAARTLRQNLGPSLPFSWRLLIKRVRPRRKRAGGAQETLPI